jgi:DinB superfamily
MNQTPLAQMIFWFSQVHKEVLALVEEISDKQIAWQPHPATTTIAFNVWHLARWADYVQARIPETTPVLMQRLGSRKQVWHVEGLASKWGLESVNLGNMEAGNDLAILATEIHLPGQAALLAYLRNCYLLEDEAIAAIDDQQFQAPRIDGGGPSEQTVGYWLMSHLVHEWEHLGMIRYVHGLYQVNKL